MKRAMEFLQEPKAMSEKDLAAQVCRAATDMLCCRNVITRTRSRLLFTDSCAGCEEEGSCQAEAGDKASKGIEGRCG